MRLRNPPLERTIPPQGRWCEIERPTRRRSRRWTAGRHLGHTMRMLLLVEEFD